MSSQKKRLVSGIQPTGMLHLGNWYGALQNWVDCQPHYDCFFLIVDLHALTTTYSNDESIHDTKLEMALDVVALGINPEDSCLFFQSEVPEHAELHLILSMITPLSWLQRVPTYKDKIKELQEKKLDTYGFLGYPVLQAADILLYQADVVPVGKDQLPHLELTREIIRRYNYHFKTSFSEPKDLLTHTPMLLGTDGRKMSKSYQNILALNDSEDVINTKIKRMFTDPKRLRRTDPGTPENCSVFQLHERASDSEVVSDIAQACRTAAIGCVDCKQKCAVSLNTQLAPYRERRQKLSENPQPVFDQLKVNVQHAREVAQGTLNEIKDTLKL